MTSAPQDPVTFTRAEPRARSRWLGRLMGSGGLGPSEDRCPEEEVIHWTVNARVRWRWRPRRGTPGAVTHRDDPEAGVPSVANAESPRASVPRWTGALFYISMSTAR